MVQSTVHGNRIKNEINFFFTIFLFRAEIFIIYYLMLEI